MAIPSVVKVTKNGVEYTSAVDRANYFIYELTRAALKDVCKFVKKRYREKYYTQFFKHTGEGNKAISSIVYSSKNTIKPRAQIGIKHAAKGTVVKGFYTFFHEVGTVHEPKRGLLQFVVEENISQIREIEAQYLSAIEDEQEALSLIDEEEYTDEE